MTASITALSSTARRLLHDAACRRLAALLFAPPDGLWTQETSSLIREISAPSLATAARQALQQADPAVYHSTFGPGGPVSLREVAHSLCVTPGALLAELAVYYEAFGYQPPEGEPPDHLAVEIDFTAFLRLKQAYALTGGETRQAGVLARAEQDFVTRHLGILVEAVLKRLQTYPIPYLTLAGNWLLGRGMSGSVADSDVAHSHHVQ